MTDWSADGRYFATVKISANKDNPFGGIFVMSMAIPALPRKVAPQSRDGAQSREGAPSREGSPPRR